MFDQLKRESLRQLRAAEDKSPKGSIDAPIVDLIQLINDHPDYVRGLALALDYGRSVSLARETNGYAGANAP